MALARELNREGGEDELEVAAVLEVSRTEEGCTKLSTCEYSLRDRLCNGALPRPSQPVQPVERALTEILRPELDLVQNCSARPFKTTPTTAVLIPGPLRAADIVDDSFFSYWKPRQAPIIESGIWTYQRRAVERLSHLSGLSTCIPGHGSPSVVQPAAFVNIENGAKIIGRTV